MICKVPYWSVGSVAHILVRRGGEKILKKFFEGGKKEGNFQDGDLCEFWFWLKCEG